MIAARAVALLFAHSVTGKFNLKGNAHESLNQSQYA